MENSRLAGRRRTDWAMRPFENIERERGMTGEKSALIVAAT